MGEEYHIVDGVDIKSNGRTIGFIRVLVNNKRDSSDNSIIHRGIKEAIKHLIDEGFDVIRRTGDGYQEEASMHIIVENMVSPAKENSIVSVRSGIMDKFPNFERIHDALIQHMVLKGFKMISK